MLKCVNNVKFYNLRALSYLQGGVWCFGGTGLEFTKTISKSPEATVEKFCLEALVFHSLVSLHCLIYRSTF